MSMGIDRDVMITYEELEKKISEVFEDSREQIFEEFFSNKKNENPNMICYYEVCKRYITVFLEKDDKKMAKEMVDVLKKHFRFFSDTYIPKSIAIDCALAQKAVYSECLRNILDHVR